MQTPHFILNKYWQHDSFRPQQEAIIMQVLQGVDTLAILPTGGGKSICYQIPALLMQGTCLVVSPLIALMKDQSYNLQQRGIENLVVHSGMNNDEVRAVYEQMSSGAYKFLFVSPERLKSVLFLDYLSDWKISLITVDEAHCISQWGYDFRPAYLEIASLKKYLPDTPILALTASATPQVQQDIIEKLQFKLVDNDSQVFFTTFARPNISFSVFEVENKIAKTIDILQKLKGSALVYCKSRKRTKEVADALISAGIFADFYHAGLTQDERTHKQDAWINNEISVIVCTNAFGMGIDKADVRCVIHYDIPDTPEAYYQEAGRAGRDGQKAYAVLLFQSFDLKDLENGIELKYPPEETIRNIYESLGYYFEVGLHHGENETFDFEVTQFCKAFNFNVLEVINTIKNLAQQGYWILSEGVYQASRVQLTCSKEEMQHLEKSHGVLDEILKQLLRMYGGIWQQYLNIAEFEIAQQIRVAKDYVIQQLRKLHALGLLHYIEAVEKPQLTYLHNRVPANQLQLNTDLMQTLKLRYTERVHFMIAFATNKTSCRMSKLLDYFAEKIVDDCAICDYCLQQKQGLQQDDFFKKVKNNILHELTLSDAINIDLFCRSYSSLQQKNVLKIIRFLLDENQLILNSEGDLMKKK